MANEWIHAKAAVSEPDSCSRSLLLVALRRFVARSTAERVELSPGSPRRAQSLFVEPPGGSHVPPLDEGSRRRHPRRLLRIRDEQKETLK